MADKLLRIGRWRKGGELMAGVEISGETLEVDLDPKNFAEPVAKALRDEISRRIAAINVEAAPATIKRRGPGKLFNVTGYLRSGILQNFAEAQGHWRIMLPAGRELPRPVLNRLIAVTKANLQNLLKVAAVRKAVEEDLPRAIVRVVGAYYPPKRKSRK